MIDHRPDPESLLKRAHEEEQAEQRGKLKIYFGAAPGVGKTYTMVKDAIANRNQGIDLIVGVVESHSRKEIDALLTELEILPRQQIDYRGIKLTEFDLDAALKRNPTIILIDEMAHTNAPGVRHEKRWQDINELLDSGINVYTTLNVQHIESLNDIVAQITGIIVRETVPDLMLEQAAAIELIDLPPEDLLKRLEEGKVYLPKQAEYATQNFFRKGNLIALRELALRITAEQVNAQVFLHRKGEAIKRIWPTVERLMVCVGPDPSSAKLIRSTFRMARSLKAEWIAVFVEAPRLRLTKQQRDSALQFLRLAEQLGGETITLTGKDVVQEITSFARLRNITKIILGKHSRSRWKTLLFGSLVDELIKYTGEIELYIIQGDTDTEKPVKSIMSFYPLAKWTDYLIALITVAVCTGIDEIIYPFFWQCNLVMVYMLGVVFVATRGRFIPSLMTSILSAFAFAYFYLPPRFSLAITDIQYLSSVVITLMVAQFIGNLTVSNQQQIEAARIRELRTATMYILSRRLANARGLDNLLQVASDHIKEVFNSEVMILLPDANNQLDIRVNHQVHAALSAKEQSVAQWVYNMGQNAGIGTPTLPESDALYIPLHGTHSVVGVLRLKPDYPEELTTPEQLHLLEGFANQIALGIEVDLLEEEAKKTALQTQADRLRGALLKSVSQNLRIPLLEMLESENKLLSSNVCVQYPTLHEEVISIARNTEQLNSLIGNLLQMTQLESGQLKLQKELQCIKEVIDRAVHNLGKQFKNRTIQIHIATDFPEIYFEAVLLEQVFIQLLDNAIKYSPPDSPIDVKVSKDKDNAIIEVQNQGEGLTAEEMKKVFDRFYRGKTSKVGMGLGLTICQSIIKAHGGLIWAENREDGEVIFCFTLPMKN